MWVGTVNTMVNADIQTLTEPDGTPVTNVAFDLSDEQLAATSHALAEMVVERHRGQALEMDDVLALRELTGVRDEVDRLAGAGGHASLVMPLGRFIALHDAVDEYVLTRTDRGWAREADEDALPFLRALLVPMDDLRARALSAALGAQTRRRAGAEHARRTY
jgi:hypothetical protein